MRLSFAGAIFLSLAGVASAKHPKIARDLDRANRSATIDVIVQFRQAPTEKHHQRIRSMGGVHKAQLHLVKSGVYSVPAAMLAQLADDPDVAYITPDRPVQASVNYAAPAVNADITQQYGWDGNGIGVAVLDSAVLAADPDLQGSPGFSRVVYSESMLKIKTDFYGHGTHVAGILAGDGTASIVKHYPTVYRGIAPGANLVSIKVLDAQGSGTDSSVIAGIQRAIALKDTYHIRVINLSLGRPVYESYKDDPLCQAVEEAWKAGIVVVVAAGNEGRNNSQETSGYGTITAPGNDPYVITVGAMKTMSTAERGDDLIASYSSKGPTLIDHIVKPDIVAPGNRIVSWDSRSTLYHLNEANRVGPGYLILSGTSMAAPVVSGAVALMLQKDPTLTPDQVKARLMKSASKNFPAYSVAIDPLTNQAFTSQYDIFTIGAGYLDVLAALNNSDLFPGSAISPTAVYDDTSHGANVMNTPAAAWSASAAWGGSAPWSMSAVWGTSVFVDGGTAVWGSSAAWSGNPVWGAISAERFSAAWGTSTAVASEAASVAVGGEN